MPMQEAEYIWMNGEMIQWKDAKIHVLSHCIHYGTAVFEGVRCYDTPGGPAVFRLKEHMERLYQSAKICEMKIPFEFDQMTEAALDTVKTNNMQACYIRPLIYLGYDSLGLNPNNCPVEAVIAVWPWGAYLGEEGMSRGIRVTVSPWRKFSPAAMPPLAKACGQYVNSVLAVRDALRKGYTEALLLNDRGDVAEGPGENLFLVKNNTVITNGFDSSILGGITRESVLEVVKNIGYPVEIRPVTIAEVFAADELFFTGTAAEVTPIREVDGREIGNGSMGPATQQIQKTFFKAVNGQIPRYRKWLTYVYAEPEPAGKPEEEYEKAVFQL